ncbi:uncharacterized protein [Littorina saxatilis]|uniref:Uncharacterized protein n=1 Tax=Littorina saxatilis TaxID=31220 RepID=A0AAN9AI97_9CAEN
MTPAILLVFVLGCTALTSSALSLDDAFADNDVTVTRQDVVRQERKVSITRLAAKDCSQAMTQSKFDDGTTSDVLDDLDNEVRVILLSATPNICYVEDVTGAKARCEDGSFKVEQGDEGSSNDTVYEQVEEMKVEDLPDRLASLCQGRTVLKVTAAAASGAAGNVAARALTSQKRKAASCTTYKSNCHECSCVGWLFRARRCRICCDEKQVCNK